MLKYTDYLVETDKKKGKKIFWGLKLVGEKNPTQPSGKWN